MKNTNNLPRFFTVDEGTLDYCVFDTLTQRTHRFNYEYRDLFKNEEEFLKGVEECIINDENNLRLWADG
jgi:hypothetical protein